MTIAFKDLQRTYAENLGGLFAELDTLSARERLDLVYANLDLANRANQVDEDKPVMPREFDRTVRWAHFDYMLTWLPVDALQAQLEAHIPSETEGGTYLRNLLATLVWKAHTPEVGETSEADALAGV